MPLLSRLIPNHRDRRVLSSPSCKTTHDFILQLLQSNLPMLTSVFDPADTSKVGLHTAYIRKGCYNDMMNAAAVKEKLHIKIRLLKKQ